MSSGVAQIAVTNVTTKETQQSLFVEYTACNQTYFSSKGRRVSTFETNDAAVAVEYDSDIHVDTSVKMVVKGTRNKVIDAFVIKTMLNSGTYVLENDGNGITVSVTYESSSYNVDVSESVTNYALQLAYLTVFSLWLGCQFLEIPYYINIIGMTTSLIYIGSHYSLIIRSNAKTYNKITGEEITNGEGIETMTELDAMKFPFIGSAALFSLYSMFKMFDPATVNFIISFYFTFVGMVAIATTVSPLVDFVFVSLSKRHVKKTMLLNHRLPSWICSAEPFDLSFDFTFSDVLSVLLSITIATLYFKTKHWTLNNLLGISFCIQGMSRFSLGTFKISAILLCGLFFYDIFWVFGTEVMVTVAKNLDGPIKILFPRSLEVDPVTGKRILSLLGLGDIVIPGFFVGLLLRFDASNARLPRIPCNINAIFPKPYFHSVLFGYVLGLSITLYVMIVWEAAQPALLYLVPSCLGSSLLCAVWRGEVGKLMKYSEEEGAEVEESWIGNKGGAKTPVKAEEKVAAETPMSNWKKDE